MLSRCASLSILWHLHGLRADPKIGLRSLKLLGGNIMQNRYFLFTFTVGALILAGCSKISTKHLTSPSPDAPSAPPQGGGAAPEAPSPSAPVGAPAAPGPSPTVSAPSAPAPVVSVPSAPAVEYEQKMAPALGSSEKEGLRKAEKDFNDQLEQAQRESESDPEKARYNALTARRAAKLKATLDKEIKEAEQE